jgi:hypothetical protein
MMQLLFAFDALFGLVFALLFKAKLPRCNSAVHEMQNRLGTGTNQVSLSFPWQIGISDTNAKTRPGTSGPNTRFPDQFYIKKT